MKLIRCGKSAQLSWRAHRSRFKRDIDLRYVVKQCRVGPATKLDKDMEVRYVRLSIINRHPFVTSQVYYTHETTRMGFNQVRIVG